jgi:VanZ family protein
MKILISITAKYNILSILILYLVLLTIALLYPFDFDFKKNNAKWLKIINGIEFEQKGQIISEGGTNDLYEMLTRGEGLTLEVWVKPFNTSQYGPARILSYSINPYFRNFTLGQSKDSLVMRLRTEMTDLNGIHPHIEVENAFVAKEILHIIVTYNYSQECVYINGQRRKCDNTLKGNFSNWDSSHKLVIGNEATGDRPWLGRIFYAAIYNRALNSKEINNKYETRLHKENCSNIKASSGSPKPVVCYLFNEKKGVQIANSGEKSLHLNLYIPNKLPRNETILNLSPIKTLKGTIHIRDIILNIFGFMPLGFLLHRLLNFNFQLYFKTISIVLIIGLTLSFGFEFLQHFLPTRISSIVDVFTNMIGLTFGIVIEKYYSMLITHK